MNRTVLFGALVAAITAVALAGCGTGVTPAAAPAPAPQAAPAAAAEHNDADTTFATSMVPHHAQAIEMAQLAADRATSSEVKELAGQIEQAQGPEIVQLQGFLAAWGEEAAPTGMGGMHGTSGMDGMGAMPGMMSDQQMKQLQAASGAAFDRMWLQMMIEHHTGAIAMARTELSSGANAEAKDLAQKVVDAQQSEITTMKQLLAAV